MFHQNDITWSSLLLLQFELSIIQIDKAHSGAIRPVVKRFSLVSETKIRIEDMNSLADWTKNSLIRSHWPRSG